MKSILIASNNQGKLYEIRALLQDLPFEVLSPRQINVDLSIEGRESFHIAMGHSPNFSLGQVEADLLIAGHTHGGQVQLPLVGPLVTLSQVPRSWASGVTEIEPGRTLIVSRGIGMERGNAPRMRFLCRPQLVILDLLPTDGRSGE